MVIVSFNPYKQLIQFFLETDSNNNNTEKLTLDFMKCINMRTNQEKNIRLETKSCRILPLTYRKKYDMT